MNNYFLRQHAARFKEGLEGREVALRVLFGGGAVVADLPRVKTPKKTDKVGEVAAW